MTNLGVPPSKWSWWYRIVLVWTVTVLTGIGVGLTFGPDRWESSTSLSVLRDDLPFIRPWVYGAMWLVTAALIAWPRSRFWGYGCAIVGATFFTLLSLLYSIVPGHVSNPVISGLALLSPLLFGAGCRYVIENEWSNRRRSQGR